MYDAARHSTGLSDFGDPFFRTPLGVLVESIEREAHLHAFGRTIVRARLIGMLENRLRIERVTRGFPEVEASPIVRPIVIAGLQRTGTTSKLALLTFATELARRLTAPWGPSVAVHGLCPGPIASRVTRDAPPVLEPIIDHAMRRLFQVPEKAALPVVYLATAPELAGDTGWYLHLMRRKAPSPNATDPENGRILWERGEAMLANWLGGYRLDLLGRPH